MAIIDSFVNKYIDAELIRANKERELAHQSSGKLSASMLYQPVRFQLLKTLGAPRREFDAYTLAKFKRGNDVEDWYVEQLKNSGVLITDQKLLSKYNLEWGENTKQFKGTYKECIGYIDSIIDTDKMQSHKGIIPNEIKSVTNAKIRLIKKKGVDWHYKIQACLYALAMGLEWFAVTIISAEDLRSETSLFRTRDMQRDIDHLIGNYVIALNQWNKNKVLPTFAPNEHVKWTSNPKYSMFEEFWSTAPDSQVITKLETLNANT